MELFDTPLIHLLFEHAFNCCISFPRSSVLVLCGECAWCRNLGLFCIVIPLNVQLSLQFSITLRDKQQPYHAGDHIALLLSFNYTNIPYEVSCIR